MTRFTIKVATRKAREAVDLTPAIEAGIHKEGFRTGLCALFVKHTTAALAAGEMGEGTQDDFLEILDKLIPKIRFRHAHDPSHAPDHMISSILGPSMTVPVTDGKLELGTWQSVLLVELNGPREREISVQLFG